MKINGNQWIAMNINGDQWKSVGINGGHQSPKSSFLQVFSRFFTGFPFGVLTWLTGGPSGLRHALGRSDLTPPNPTGSFLLVFYSFFTGF